MNSEAVDIFAWTQAEAIELCRQVEAVCVPFGCHVALTGGLLYKEGPRKDCDLMFYRIRQKSKIDEDRLWNALGKLGLHRTSSAGYWVVKANYNGKTVDCLFPENYGDKY